MWIDLIKEVGPYLGILFFFIYRDYRREEHLIKQIDDLQKFIQGELINLIQKTNEILDDFMQRTKD